MKWKDLSPEERKKRRAQHRLTKERRLQREEEEKSRVQQRYDDDETCTKFRPGDWMRYREGWGVVSLQGKLVRLLDWDNDDGFNEVRAPRNLKVIIEIEPHLSDDPKTMRCKLWGFQPVPEMEVIAEAAR